MQGRRITIVVVGIVVVLLALSAIWTAADSLQKEAAVAKHEGKHSDEAGQSTFLRWAADNGIWTVVVFFGVLVLLRILAWKPWRNGTRQREEAIRQAIEEAMLLREQNARDKAAFEAKMREAYAEIPKLKEEALRDGEALRDELKKKAHQEIEEERRRLTREINTARDQALQDLWNQATQMATLMSAKTIGQTLNDEDHRRLTDQALSDVKQAGERWKTEMRQ